MSLRNKSHSTRVFSHLQVRMSRLPPWDTRRRVHVVSVHCPPLPVPVPHFDFTPGVSCCPGPSLTPRLAFFLEACLCLPVSVCLYLCLCLSVCLSLCLCLSLCVCLSLSLCLFLCLCLFVPLFTSVSLSPTLPVHTHVHTCTRHTGPAPRLRLWCPRSGVELGEGILS